MIDDAEGKVLKNESDVQEAIAKVKQTSDVEKNQQEVNKVTLRMKNAISNFTSLSNEIAKIPEIGELSETQIRDYILASKDWKRRLEKHQSTKEAIDLEAISTDIGLDNEELKSTFKTAFESMLSSVNLKMEELSKADKTLGLHSLSDSKAMRML